jgi:fatty-acid desaturase
MLEASRGAFVPVTARESLRSRPASHPSRRQFSPAMPVARSNHLQPHPDRESLMPKTLLVRPVRAGIAWPPVLWIGGLHAGALLAFVPAYIDWYALAACVSLYWLTAGLGICMTYHRLLTHRSFALRPGWLEYLLTAVGCCASEGGAIGWVADHRKHHAHADDGQDVHSPTRGLACAHMLWWMTPDVTSIHDLEDYGKWAPDLTRDPIHRALDRFHFLFPLLMFAALYALGGMPWPGWPAA